MALFRLFALLFSLTLAVYASAKALALYEWVEWYRLGGNPVLVKGSMEIVSRKGRDKGSQFVWVRNEMQSGRYDAYFSAAVIQDIRRQKNSAIFEVGYFPIATGKKLIYRVFDVDRNGIVYDGIVRKDLWQGPLAGVFVILYFFISVVVFLFSIGFIRKRD